MAMVLAGSARSTRAQILKAMKLPDTASDDEVDFHKQSEHVRGFINQWVSDNTMGKIVELLPPDSIDADTISVIVNALYFKGQWKQRFDSSITHEGEFTKQDGSKKKVQMMSTKGDFDVLYLREEEANAIKIPFLGSKWSMFIILPNSHNGLPKTLEMLQKPDRLKQILNSQFGSRETTILLPKFKLTQDIDVDAKGILEEMGIVDVFSEPLANLSGISKNEKLYISYIHHKAILEVDEEGATAAAATAMTIRLGSSGVISKFKVEHSFVVCLIYDNDLPVFIGHVVDLEDNKNVST